MPKEVPLERIAGNEYVEIEIQGTTYKASPLSLLDLGEFRNIVKNKKLSMFLKAAREADLDREFVSEQINRIMDAAPNITGEGENREVDDSALRSLATEEGMQYILYLAVRKNHPDVSMEDVELPLSKLAEVTEHIGMLTGADILDELEPEGSEERPPEEDGSSGTSS